MTHLTLQQKAWGLECWLPKSHYVTHLPRQLQDQGMLVSTFMHERKHKTVKQYADPRHNTSSFEKSLLTDLTCQHLYVLRARGISAVDLKEPRPACQKMVQALRQHLNVIGDDVLTAHVAYVQCRAVAAGDTVSFHDRAGSLSFGEVYFHIKTAGAVMSCISVWQTLDIGDSSARCVVQENPTMFPTDSIVEPCISYTAELGSISHLLFSPKLMLRAKQA
eukprot:9127497-Pyramimonas_sp.AAC.1